MRRLLLISALFLSTLSLGDTHYDYEFTPLIGYNYSDSGNDLNNHTLLGAEIEFKRAKKVIYPELSLLYSRAEYESTSSEPDIYRVALNGVYEFDKLSFITPLAKAGLGYRTLDVREDATENTIFIDAGVGAKLRFTKRLSLKIEALYMLDYNDNRLDNNIALLAGLNIGFGGTTIVGKPRYIELDEDGDGVEDSLDKCSGTPTGTVVDTDGCKLDTDDDNDGVLNSMDECPESAAGVTVDAAGCKIDGDDDNDGILNSMDQCPDTLSGLLVDDNGCKVDRDDDGDGILNSLDRCPETPAGKVVLADGCVDGDDDNDGILNSKDECPNTSDQVNSIDELGCVKDFNMQISFKRKSFDVDEQSNKNIEKFADFLNTNMIFKTKLVGYTDSMGRESDNQILSEKRAATVKELLINNGVSSDRITTEGRGEADPIADNETEEGRAQNRRIEAELSRTQ